jgi:hypothetical protein
MGRFAEVSDVTDRFEGTIPDDRTAWVDTRIDDVEAALMGLVPSLEELANVIGELADASGAARLARVKTLVCEKVLHLYRNPDGATQWSNTVDDVTESRTFGYGKATFGVTFTSAELRSVRLPRVKRLVGTIPVAPWVPRRLPPRCF